ncbi:MAG: hypothetical protein NTV51_22600 [Verrucomicrobia bacterium]|nr:hypothetical protein [Verrucomicrobiota bacterium]
MRLLLQLFSPRPTHRSTLRALHASGLVSVFRRDSVFRLWEPLRQHPGLDEEFTD